MSDSNKTVTYLQVIRIKERYKHNTRPNTDYLEKSDTQYRHPPDVVVAECRIARGKPD